MLNITDKTEGMNDGCNRIDSKKNKYDVWRSIFDKNIFVKYFI